MRVESTGPRQTTSDDPRTMPAATVSLTTTTRRRASASWSQVRALDECRSPDDGSRVPPRLSDGNSGPGDRSQNVCRASNRSGDARAPAGRRPGPIVQATGFELVQGDVVEFRFNV